MSSGLKRLAGSVALLLASLALGVVLLELAVLRDQCDDAYERARRDATNAGKATGSNENERLQKLRAVQVRPGKTILDLRIDRDHARTAYSNVKLLIDKLEKQIEVLQTLHVTHRNASASGPRG